MPNSIQNYRSYLRSFKGFDSTAHEKFAKYYNIQLDYAIAAVVRDPRLNVSNYLDENNLATLEQAESAKREVLHYFDINYKPQEIPGNAINSNSQQLEDIDRIYKKRKLILGGNCEVRLPNLAKMSQQL